MKVKFSGGRNMFRLRVCVTVGKSLFFGVGGVDGQNLVNTVSAYCSDTSWRSRVHLLPLSSSRERESGTVRKEPPSH